MMNNKSVWFICVAFVAAIVVGLLLALPSMLTANDDQAPMTASEFTKIYKDALISPLEKASSEANDPELAGFSKKLISSYELEKTAANVNEQSNLSDVLPDIVKINKTALEMPLKEAGTQLKDKELSEFYDRFIKKCGVE